MHTNVDGFFLPREHQRMLLEILRRIPDLVIELAISETKQTRLGGRLGGRQKGEYEQPFPFSQAAIDAGENLHAVLGSWVRHVCEHRGLDFRPDPHAVDTNFIGPLTPDQWRMTPRYTPSTPTLAHWLDKNIISLALTPGAESSYGEIKQAVQRAVWIVCPPPEQIIIDYAKYQRARNLLLNASGIGTLAKELGEEYRNLTARRVQVLRDAKVIRPAVSLSKQWRPDWPALYILGQVLDAHLAHPIRQRHTRALPA